MASLDDVNLMKGKEPSNDVRKQNTWAMEVDKKKSPDADLQIEYNPRGSRYLDVDDGILPNAEEREKKNQWPLTRIVGAILAVVSFIILVCIKIPDADGNDYSRVNRCLAVLVPMIFLWLFSVFSPNLTALLPIPLYALLELDKSTAFAKEYLTDTGILFVGIFILCTAMEACNVHRRFALFIIDKIARTPATFMLGFMIPPWFLSLFSSNTGACAMILPIAMATMDTSILKAKEKGDEEGVAGLKLFEKGLYMAIAYSATIGGTGTIVATPPNALVVTRIETDYPSISMGFGDWMGAFIPLSITLQICCFAIMYYTYGRQVKSIDRSFIKAEYAKLGRMNRDEIVVCVVFVVMMLWMVLAEVTTKVWVGRCEMVEKNCGKGIKAVYDNTALNKNECDGKWIPTFGTGAIALFCSTFLFLIPSKKHPSRNLIDWKMAESGIPWGIILLMGGGNALSKAFKDTLTTKWIAGFLKPLASLHTTLLILIVTTMVALLTEITSNTATTSILLPIFVTFANENNFHPLLLCLPTALAASMAFMLPIATPPNAVVLGTGKVPFLGFVKAGWKMNVAGILLTTFFVCTTATAIYSLLDAPEAFREKWACKQPNATMACP